MNTLKRTLALVATLAMAATAFASCGDDKKESSSKADETTTAAQEDTTAAEETTAEAEPDGIDPSVGVGGDTFTVATWNHDDVEGP